MKLKPNTIICVFKFCIPESFNTNQLLDCKIIFVNSQGENTNLKGDFVLLAIQGWSIYNRLQWGHLKVGLYIIVYYNTCMRLTRAMYALCACI